MIDTLFEVARLREIKAMPDEEIPLTERRTVTETAGTGCLVQGVGLLCPFVLGAFGGIEGAVLGVLLFVILLVAGSSMSKKLICGNCGNSVRDNQVKMCGVCKSRFIN